MATKSYSIWIHRISVSQAAQQNIRVEVSDNLDPLEKNRSVGSGAHPLKSTQAGRSAGYIFVDVRTPEEVEARALKDALAVAKLKMYVYDSTYEHLSYIYIYTYIYIY